MGVWIAYRLLPRSPLHLGERGVGMEETSVTIRADTLFSALCVTLRELGEDLSALCRGFPRAYAPAHGHIYLEAGDSDEPPFLLSSTFPFAGDVFFLPRPMLRPVDVPTDLAPSLGKTLKKVRFVSKPIFEAMLRGTSLRPFLAKGDGRGGFRTDVFLQDGALWVTPDELATLAAWRDDISGRYRLWAKTVAPRVTVDRVNSHSQVYGVGQVHFARGAGLYFLAQFRDENVRKRIERALRVLGDSGIGGERSSGYGQFEIASIERFQLQEPDEDASNGFCTLSPFWPGPDEVDVVNAPSASYLLLPRRGWIASPDGMNLRRRTVRMLAEGTVLPLKPRGALVDVKPIEPLPVRNVPHDVWRYGMAFPVRCVR